MKIVLLCSILIVFLLSICNAEAEGIKGRLGITGQVGFIAPVNSSYADAFVTANALSDDRLKSDASFAGGGGLILGLTRNVALEAGALYFPKMDFENAGAKALQIAATDVSLGLQLRNNVSQNMAAYLGAGVDVLLGDVKDAKGNKGDLDTVIGGHANVGGDYFLTKYVALNFDLRGLFFPETDLKSGGVTVVKFNPISFVGLFGARFFVN